MRWGCIRYLSSLQLKPQGNLQPTTAINDHQETILLYRALLRQCTYLPDPAARKYMWTYVTGRFHAYCSAFIAPDGCVTYPRRKKRISDALKGARKGLKYLQRANDGHTQHLYTILAMTYGRVGKRKRQLMTKLQAPAYRPIIFQSRYLLNRSSMRNSETTGLRCRSSMTKLKRF